jgi:hypothetical protein
MLQQVVNILTILLWIQAHSMILKDKDAGRNDYWYSCESKYVTEKDYDDVQIM